MKCNLEENSGVKSYIILNLSDIKSIVTVDGLITELKVKRKYGNLKRDKFKFKS
jgi:hypothetical protein